ncbi:MAG: winged helix-turn-helix domain-containing protein [Archaeoglobaceae archaeon]|nr:winged helix-turn-helix domain-containing protein [Archaeoglobaceae archaeon]MDW8118070.1 winged helix-turn-helix domain-containing protein [Archaeoglobaceae archaeon]
MGEVVHVVAITSESTPILESIKSIGYPIHKAYIVYRRKDSTSAVESVNRALSSLVDSKIINFVGKNVYEMVWELLDIVKQEIEKGNSVLFNISDADRALCMAFLISAQISNSKIYLGAENGAKFIQTPPLKKFNGDRIKILKVLLNEGGSVDSINKLIELVDGKIEEQKKYMAQRARMSYHLNELEDDGLVVTERKGKHLKIAITDLGKAYVVMFG